MAKLLYVPEYVCKLQLDGIEYHGIGFMGADCIAIRIPAGYVPELVMKIYGAISYTKHTHEGYEYTELFEMVEILIKLDSNDYDIVDTIDSTSRTNKTDMMILAPYYPEYWGNPDMTTIGDFNAD
jgi:hypothetical protein